MSDIADSTPEPTEADTASVPVETVQPVKRTPAKRTPARRRAGGAAKRTPARRAPREAASPRVTATSSLASALRELVGGIETEVASITSLSAEIDQHVDALNGLRAEATSRLLHLDDLRSAAEDVNLSAFLDTSIQPQLPKVEEDFPDRIYGG